MDKTTEAFIKNLYKSGLSQDAVAKELGISRWQVRRVAGKIARKRKVRPFEMFDGKRFSRDEQGYWCWKPHRGPKLWLHRYKWEFHNGLIPKYHEIHHKDFDKDNNDIENFECLWFWKHALVHAEARKNKEPGE